jgi:hypothetical protein
MTSRERERERRERENEKASGPAARLVAHFVSVHLF